jgi:hypothetical protein
MKRRSSSAGRRVGERQPQGGLTASQTGLIFNGAIRRNAMRLDIDDKTVNWIKKRGGKVSVLPPQAGVG